MKWLEMNSNHFLVYHESSKPVPLYSKDRFIRENVTVPHPILDKKIKVQYDSSLPGEARAKVYHNKILLGDKFFKLPADAKIHVFTHELGHFFEHEVLKPDIFWKVIDSELLGSAKGTIHFEGILGTFSAEEALAEAYAIYRLQPKELLKRHPQVYRFIQEIDQGKTTEQALKEVHR